MSQHQAFFGGPSQRSALVSVESSPASLSHPIVGTDATRATRGSRARLAGWLVIVAALGFGCSSSSEPLEPIELCDEARATIGPAGGSVELCDAQATVEAGVLTEEVELVLERVVEVPDPAEPFALIGEAWRISTDGGDTFPVLLELSHESERPLELVRLEDDAWVVEGACEATPTEVVQTVTSTGTFALVTDPRPLPIDPTGLGDAEIAVTLGDREIALETGAVGFLTDEISLSGLRTFAFYAVSGSVSLSGEVAQLPDGTALPVFVFVEDAATGEAWSSDVFTRPDSLLASVTYDAGEVSASLEGALVGGSEQEVDEIEVSITLGGNAEPWWREPPRICIGE
jgi:hypothetical protein